VPAGHYFMMGDNRDDSEDSRFSRKDGGVGFLPADYLIGRSADHLLLDRLDRPIG
jgi:signal peptidase I